MARQDRDVLAEDHLAPSSDSSGCGLGISTEDCYANQALASEAIAVGEGEDNALMAV